LGHGWPEWLDGAGRLQLTAAWVRRKQFEARLIAYEVARIFAPAPPPAKSREAAWNDLLSVARVEHGD